MDVMSTSKIAKSLGSEDQAKVGLEEESAECRNRTPTGKGYLYQVDLKTSNLRTKKYM